MTHRFAPGGGPCIDCSTPGRPITPELVADRRAPPFCAERPQELQERDYDDARESANPATGY